MTQSGQGEEPSARPAHEGIVLPSDGGEPLLPGMTNGSYSRPRPHEQQQPPSASAPAGGQTWGQPWGPEQQQPGQGWPLPADQQQWGDAAQGAGSDAWSQQSPDGGVPSRPAGAGPLPPEGAPAPSYGQGIPGAPLPPADEGATQYIPPVPSGPGGEHGGQYLPPVADGATRYIPPVPSGPGGDQAAHYLPPAAADDGATQYIPPVPSGPGGEHGGQYLPPAADGATQYIPPVPAASGDDGATQYIPPVPSGPGGDYAAHYPQPAPADEGATQYLPPVAPGALPPETSSESTHYLGRAQQNGASGPAAPGGHSDAEATQYIPPVTGQGPYGGGGAGGAGGADRQPPAGFENLFRDGPAADGPPGGSTQQLPRFSKPEGAGHAGSAAPRPAYTPPGDGSGGRRGGRDDDHGRGRGGRTGTRVPLYAAIGVGIAVVGVGAGALLGAGGDGGDQNSDNKTVAASASASTSEGSASASADGAEQQAIALDKLLADSGSSRATVISAVADVKACTDLAQAASDLRGAAKQRNELVTKLAALSVDQLPNHDALTTALNKAWQASASADDHYAAWADQVAGDKKQNCKKGQARSTAQTQAGNRASGTASTQKTKAAEVWNEIAREYGLTQRQPVQL
ncbi:hypothetical protein [Streptomyces sp. NPDC002328]|uniref:hypothetical protein n=1 Tax=Streptomyces sp. NPDC002328 TaxID=3364642 RepID=UPI0036B8C1D0